MRSFQLIIFINLFKFIYLAQVLNRTGIAPSKPQNIRDLFNLRQLQTSKQAFQLSTLTNPRRALLQGPHFIQQGKTIQRREVPFQQTFLGVPVQIENVKQAEVEKKPVKPLYPQLPKLPPVKPLIKPNETEAERAERIHKSFDRLLTFVEIVGQVDNYVSSKWKNLVKTVSNFYETEDEPRVSSRKNYPPCPYAH